MNELVNPNPNPKNFLVVNRINGFTAVAPTDLQSLPTSAKPKAKPDSDSDSDPALALASLAAKALAHYGLSRPKAGGRVVFYACDATGHVAVDSAANWNAGRVSHRHCCRALLKEEADAHGHPALEFVVQSKSLSKFGGVNAQTLAKSRSLQTALQTALSQPQPLSQRDTSVSLFVSNRAPSAVAALREYILEPSTIEVLQWLNTISSGNEATQPVFRSALDDLYTQTAKTQRVLQEQIAHLRSVAGELDLIGRPTVESATRNPVIAPMLLWGSVAVPDEYGDPTGELTHTPWYAPYDLAAANPDEYPLSPECQAALAVMAMQTAMIYGSKHRDANEIFERLKAKAPLDLRGHKWFQVISVEPGYITGKGDAGTFVTSTSGEQVDVEAEVRLMLVKPPPRALTLPLNYADFPRVWDWSTSRLVPLEWPKSFKEAVEMS